MYVRPSDRKYGGVRLPDNYSGSTFREEPSAELADVQAPAEIKGTEPTPPLIEQSAGVTPSGGIGSEELLLLALILLTSDKKDNDELILLLALILLAK